MHKLLTNVLKALSLLLLVVIVLQARDIVSQEDLPGEVASFSRAGTRSAAATSPETEDVGEEEGPAGATAGDKEKAKPSRPLLPENFKPIDTSGIFGRAPVKQRPPPALLGIAGEHAFLRLPDGNEDCVKAGETVAGVRVVQIGINRVIIEYEEKQLELTIYSGLGSDPLLPQKKAQQ